ncbi:MAG: AAA family ATPase [Candidatus Marinimicrobia bacterium]|nr:AAA family ATPase [Candidatus Neomarinimicrobiota bacterium]
MKIKQLDLIAIGPFTKRNIAIEDNINDFHIIYGVNESGKSSALNALRYLLYGIPDRTSYDFLHQYAKMRIGGILRHSDNSHIEFIRRKGKKNTLYSPDDEYALKENALDHFLSNVDSDRFNTMFGIGHSDLVAGGQEIIRGGGALGQALFSAGTGISDFRKLLVYLQTEAEKLFTPTARKRKINQILNKLNENHREIRAIRLLSSVWQKHDRELRQTEKLRTSIEEEISKKRKQIHHLDRIRSAYPLIAQRKSLQNLYDQFKEAVLLPDGFGDQVREYIHKLRTAQEMEGIIQINIKEIEKSIREIVISERILKGRSTIKDLFKELGSYQKAQKDRNDLQTRISGLSREAKSILREFDNSLKIENAEKYRLKKVQIEKIRSLSSKCVSINSQNEDCEKNIQRLKNQLEIKSKDISQLNTPVRCDELKKAVEKSIQSLILEKQFYNEQAEIQKDVKIIEKSLAQQNLWKKDPEELDDLILPSMETIEEYSNIYDKLIGKIERTEEVISDLDDQISKSDGLIAEIQLKHEVPTEIDLINARNQRNTGWKLIRSKLENAKIPEKAVSDFTFSIKPDTDLPEAFEISMENADNIADRLRREADRVANKAKLIAERQVLINKSNKEKDSLDKLKMQLKSAEKNWFKEWKTVGIEPLSPRRMRTWTLNQNNLIEKYRTIQERISKNKNLKSAFEDHTRILTDCLGKFKISIKDKTKNLSELINIAEKFIKQQEENFIEYNRLRTEIKLHEAELNSAIRESVSLQNKLETWQQAWGKAVVPLGLAEDATPEQASIVMDEISSLFKKLEEASILKSRIKGIDRDADNYIYKAKEFVREVAPELYDLNIEEVISELNFILNQSLKAEMELDNNNKQLKKEIERKKINNEQIVNIKVKLDEMCREAKCNENAQLLMAENNSKERRRIEKELKLVEARLTELSAGTMIEDFIAEAEKVDFDSIEGDLLKLEDQIKDLEFQKSQLDEKIGEEKNELGKMDGNSRTAELEEKRQEILATLENDVLNYSRFKIGEIILTNVIEKYRKEHQDPVLQKTNRLFSKLTVGSFRGVRAEIDEKGQPYLVGVRAENNEIVKIEGMSDGTIDQLFLALRLASLENYLEMNEPMPFIVDDILIKFDNQRAIATLKILSELSKKCQVLFFTHHQHLVDLAINHIPKTGYCLYNLNGESV